MSSTDGDVFSDVVVHFKSKVDEVGLNHFFVSTKEEQNAEVRAFEKSVNNGLRASVPNPPATVFCSMGSSSIQPQVKDTKTADFGFGLFKTHPDSFRKRLWDLKPVLDDLYSKGFREFVMTTAIGYVVERGDAPYGIHHVPNDTDVIRSLLIDNPTANKKNPEGDETKNGYVRQNWVNFWIFLQVLYPDCTFYVKSRMVPSDEKIQNKWVLDDELMTHFGLTIPNGGVKKPKYFCDWGGGQIIAYQEDGDGGWKYLETVKISTNELFSELPITVVDHIQKVCEWIGKMVERDPEFANAIFIQTGLARQFYFASSE